MEKGLNIDYNIPLWGIISMIAVGIVPMVWSLITMYFGLKQAQKELADLKEDIGNQEKSIAVFKKGIEEKIDDHKMSTDSKLSVISNTMISTKTLVELLVNNKLK